MEMKDLNSIYKNDAIFYWTNSCGDVNLPGDPADKIVIHKTNELPPKAKELFENYWSKGDDTSEYVVSINGKFGLAFVYLFDDEWERETQVSPNFLKARLPEKLGIVFTDFGMEAYFGERTDPDGDELLLFIPYEIKDYIQEVKGILNSGLFDPHDFGGDKLPEELVDRIENANFCVTEDNSWFHFGKYSSAGQDFGFDIPKGKTLLDVGKNIKNYYEDFDVSAEAYLWLDNTGHGTNGAPYEMKDVVADMEECKSFIKELYNIFIDYIEPEI